MKISITADDGTPFETQEECLAYEAALPLMKLFADIEHIAAESPERALDVERRARKLATTLADERIEREGGPRRSKKAKGEAPPPVHEDDAPAYTLPATDDEIRAGEGLEAVSDE